MKTKKTLFKEVEKEILKIHDYETCEIISYDITNGNEKFLKWIEEETKQKKWEGSNKLYSQLDLWNKLNEENTLQEVQ